jgi:hypothetical protein
MAAEQRRKDFADPFLDNASMLPPARLTILRMGLVMTVGITTGLTI